MERGGGGGGVSPSRAPVASYARKLSNINGPRAADGARYQCANVGFLPLKLTPSFRDNSRALSLATRPSTAFPLSPANLPLKFSSFLLFRAQFADNILPRLGKMSLITTTTTTTTRFYRRGHLLENNIHKVEPRRYQASFSIHLRAYSILHPSPPYQRDIRFCLSLGRRGEKLSEKKKKKNVFLTLRYVTTKTLATIKNYKNYNFSSSRKRSIFRYIWMGIYVQEGAIVSHRKIASIFPL